MRNRQSQDSRTATPHFARETAEKASVKSLRGSASLHENALLDALDKVIESYYLETREGLFFAVKGLEHPPDRIISVVRYAPDPENGNREKGGITYRRLYHFPEQEQFLHSSYPHFLAYDPVFQKILQSVPKSTVQRVYDPRRRLQEMAQTNPGMAVEEDAVAFAKLLQRESGVPLSDIGISGSLLIGLHTEHSDLDISVFGAWGCRTVYVTLQKLLDSGSVEDLRRLEMDGIEELYSHRVVDPNIPFGEFAPLEKSKICQGSFRRRPYFIRFIREAREAGDPYGTVQYTPLGRATITAVIDDDQEAIFTPCRYALTNVRVLEGSPAAVTEIISFRGRFCEQARKGDIVAAAGTAEQIESSTGIRYRLLLGNSTEDHMVVRR